MGGYAETSKAATYWRVSADGSAPDFSSDQTFGVDVSFRFSIQQVMDDYARLLGGNPKVWAVCASQDPAGINVWTYIDSPDEGDRMSVYEREWQLMKLYPDVAFDFNSVAGPAGSETFDDAVLDYVYVRRS